MTMEYDQTNLKELVKDIKDKKVSQEEINFFIEQSRNLADEHYKSDEIMIQKALQLLNGMFITTLLGLVLLNISCKDYIFGINIEMFLTIFCILCTVGLVLLLQLTSRTKLKPCRYQSGEWYYAIMKELKTTKDITKLMMLNKYTNEQKIKNIQTGKTINNILHYITFIPLITLIGAFTFNLFI